MACFAIVITAGCGDNQDARIREEIAVYEKTDPLKAAAAPAVPTNKDSGFPIKDKVTLKLDMNRQEVVSRLPRSANDPPDTSSGLYDVAIRSLADGGVVSLSFRRGKLASITVNRRYPPTEAGKYRAWLEQTYGRPYVSGNRISWRTAAPMTSVVATFHGDEGGYRVETSVFNDEVRRDVTAGQEPGTQPIPAGSPSSDQNALTIK